MTDKRRPDVWLRRAGPDDAAFMRDLARTAYAHYVSRVGAEPGPMREDYDQVVRVAECWIVSDGPDRIVGRDIGYLVLQVEPDHVLLDNVAVAPDRQGDGVGAFLLDFSEDRARLHGRDEVRLYTHVTMVENLAFYARHGFVETHRRQDEGFLRVFMNKPLARSSG